MPLPEKLLPERVAVLRTTEVVLQRPPVEELDAADRDSHRVEGIAERCPGACVPIAAQHYEGKRKTREGGR
jgi:hypothetical protein